MVKIVKDELTELMGGDQQGVNLSSNPTIILLANKIIVGFEDKFTPC